MKKLFLSLIAITISLLLGAIWGYSNPEKIEIIKSFFKERTKPVITSVPDNVEIVRANYFSVSISEIVTLSEKTAFVIYDENLSIFDKKKLKIYTQNGYLIENFKPSKINLPRSFTMQRNGGVKTIFTQNNKQFALISSSKINCFYASIVYLENGKEIFRTKCLPDSKKNTDFNGLGSSNIHHKDKILITLGAPEQSSSKIAILAQDKTSNFGKILEVSKENLNNIILNNEINLKVKIHSMGHRNPQGIAKINDNIFSVEHGPRGGDELNKISKGNNYGWPNVSYGTKYLYDNEGVSYNINHESKNFLEPLFALVPSVGISALNACPLTLKKFYKKPCLIALSLSGNNLRPGKSLIIYLLSENMEKVHSIEQIFLGNDYRLRHFVTNNENALYEDNEGSIYVSADKKGIYKISFLNFR